MNKTKITILVLVALLVGLVAGFFLNAPISGAISLNAGGVITPSADGIWTGTEYAKPWEWSSTQWGSFADCVRNRRVGSVQWRECAANTIAKSPFSGNMTAVITGSLKTDQTTLSFKVTATGAVSGSVTGMAGNGFPINSSLKGYISPTGELNISVGKANLAGFVIYEGPGKTSSSKVFDGSLIDTDSPNSPAYSVAIFTN